MSICYRDELGVVSVALDRSGVSFCNGYAYFTDDSGRDYKIPVNNLITVTEEE